MLRVRRTKSQSLSRTFRGRNRQPSGWNCWRNVVSTGVGFNELCGRLVQSRSGDWRLNKVAWHNNRHDGLLPYLCAQEVMNVALHWGDLSEKKKKNQRIVQMSRYQLTHF